MTRQQARAVLEKELKSYRTKLGLARHYAIEGSTHPFRQRRKTEKYAEIVKAFETILKEIT